MSPAESTPAPGPAPTTPEAAAQPEAPAPPEVPSGSNKEISDAVLASIIISSVALCALVAGLLLLLLRHRNSKKAPQGTDMATAASMKGTSSAAVGPADYHSRSDATWGKSYSGTEVRAFPPRPPAQGPEYPCSVQWNRFFIP